MVDPSSVSTEATFTALFNFRDVGGYATRDGRAVRRRRLYRSDSLHRIDGADRATFGALGIRTVLDLRRPTEVAEHGRVPEYDGLAYHHIHPEHRQWEEVPYDERLGLARYLADRYLDLAETGTVGLAEAVGVVADDQSAPVVVHCVAGKDRTGVLCALILSVLDVADAVIADDYALSTAASERYRAWIRTLVPPPEPLPPPYLASPAEAMTLFLAGLRQRHGSVEGYLRDAGVTPAQLAALRNHLIE